MTNGRFQAIRSMLTYVAAHQLQGDGDPTETSHLCFNCHRRVWGYASRCPACTDEARVLFANASDRRMPEVMRPNMEATEPEPVAMEARP
jgi:hypothetical protein